VRRERKDLEGRGVVFNREVEICRNRGASLGELTDIHVDALARSPGGEEYDVVSAIIEVKGCWHSELVTAMETQLTGRYLEDNPLRHGLYLVGWFSCDQWDGRDQ
jgi:hypothetical protein